jgi:integrase
MASLRRRTNGTWEIQFRDEYRRKKTITLSGNRYKERIARQLQDAVTVLIDKKINRDPTQDRVTKTWVENAPLEIREKLARFGLYELPLRHTAQELWDTFLARHEDMYGETRRTYLHARDRFFAFFGLTELLDELTQERMKEWRRFLLDGGKYAPATVAGTISKAKAVFNWAKREHWITVSPLDGVARGSFRNREKDCFITREEYHRLLDACPCQEWKTIIALARIGGLHPCEILTLRWSDIDKSKHRLRVFNSKLRQHERLCMREVPLFKEMVVELDRLRSLPDSEGQEYVINRYANREKSNLGTQFARIARQAGIGKIPRPFDNMRASRSTEVYHEYGAKKESLWIGHSVKVALESYLMVTDDDYAVAAGKKVIQSIDKTELVCTSEVMSV